MNATWWQMPGPAELVRRVVSDLEDGQSVVVGLPPRLPEGFADAVQRGLDHPQPLREWGALPEPPAHCPSVGEWLAHQWYGSAVAADLLADDPQALIDHADYERGRVWVPPVAALPPPAHQQWLGFMNDYQRAQGPLTSLRRSPLLLILGTPATLVRLPTPEPLLAVRTYRTQQTSLDLLLYLSGCLPLPNPPTRGQRLYRQLLLHMAIALFATDPETARTFVAAGQADPTAAVRWVEAHRQSPDWQPVRDEATGNPNEDWARGWAGHVDGQPLRHLCAPNTSSLADQVRQHCLMAQMQIILPWLEQQRWQLLNHPEIHHHLSQRLPLKLPATGQDEESREITQVFALEYSHILYLLPPSRRAATSELESDQLRQRLRRLRHWRNSLSHLTPLSAAELAEWAELADGFGLGGEG